MWPSFRKLEDLKGPFESAAIISSPEIFKWTRENGITKVQKSMLETQINNQIIFKLEGNRHKSVHWFLSIYNGNSIMKI